MHNSVKAPGSKGAIELPPRSRSKTQTVLVTSNKQSTVTPQALAEATVLLMESMIQGWHKPHQFPSHTGWSGLLEARWSWQAVAEVKLKNELNATLFRFLLLFSHHSRTKPFNGSATLAGKVEIGNNGVRQLLKNMFYFPNRLQLVKQ